MGEYSLFVSSVDVYMYRYESLLKGVVTLSNSIYERSNGT